MLSICIRNFEILNKPLKIKKILYFSHKVAHLERRYGVKIETVESHTRTPLRN
jgi:hypothetical protein